MSSAQHVLDRMMMKDSASSEQQDGFIPVSSWQGTKPGYFFGTGKQGTGYYLDQKESGTTSKVPKPKRSVNFNEDNNEMRIFTSAEALLEQAEKKASGTAFLELTPKGIQSASQALEKLFHKNALQRAQHPDDPRQYMESELALHDQLQALTAVAANVQLYQHIIESDTLMDTLTQLLGHENDDIAATVVSLYLEWLDPTLLQDDPDLIPTIASLASRVLSEAWETIFSNFTRFQNEDTNTQDPSLKGIENSLSLVENLLDIDLLTPSGIVREGDKQTKLSAAAFIVKESTFLSWLFEQVDQDDLNLEFQSRCIELAAFVAQREDVFDILPDWSKLPTVGKVLDSSADPPAKKPKISPNIDAIECMLQIIGTLRKRQPVSEQETELLENACLALDSCISLSNANLVAFLKGQGVELVVRCLKERVHSGLSTLRLLEFSGKSDEHKQACERVVTAGGLKFLFPLFLGTRIPKPSPSYSKSDKSKREWLNRLETLTIRIFYCLCLHLDENSPDDARERFVAKFTQDESKCDRVVELLLYYDEKARKAEYQFYRSDVEEVVEDDETVQLAALEAKLKGGGDLFHRIGALAAFLAVHSKRCHERILEQLKLQQSGISLVKASLEEFISLLEGGSPQRQQLETYMSRI